MLRPALIPAAGKQFVVADWSALRLGATLLSGGGEDVLDVFRSGQDIYVREASLIFKTDEVTPDMRQIGKVAILSSATAAVWARSLRWPQLRRPPARGRC